MAQISLSGRRACRRYGCRFKRQLRLIAVFGELTDEVSTSGLICGSTSGNMTWHVPQRPKQVVLTTLSDGTKAPVPDRRPGHSRALCYKKGAQLNELNSAAPLGSVNYLIRKFSFLSLVPFISSRIQIGVAPRPAQVSFGSFLLRYFRRDLSAFRLSETPIATLAAAGARLGDMEPLELLLQAHPVLHEPRIDPRPKFKQAFDVHCRDVYFRHDGLLNNTDGFGLYLV